MNNKKVIVGLSGGVDSSVACKLLLDQNYKVEASFMRNWDSAANNDILGNDHVTDNICPQEKDYLDAKNIAKIMNINLHRIDFVNEYWEYVFEYFINEYKKGRTPNPDILCNKYIKFDKFLNYAIDELNADYIATGHYAGIRYNEKTEQYELLKAKDSNKDQTYFLCALTQDKLSKILFPLYEYNKSEIRNIAKENNFITANKKDSTGICFIGERRFTDFLQNYISNQKGDIINIINGDKLGEHIGTMYYTIGQRKNLNLSGMKEPFYVCKKDIEKKIIYVCPISNNSYLYSNECIVEEISWTLDIKKYFNNIDEFECTAKFRYRQEDNHVKLIKISSETYKVFFKKPIKSITPGQQAVFYLNDICIGGGIIK